MAKIANTNKLKRIKREESKDKAKKVKGAGYAPKDLLNKLK